MFNNPVELEFTSSGHYCVNILKTKPELSSEENILNDIDEMIPTEKHKTLVKLHK